MNEIGKRKKRYLLGFGVPIFALGSMTIISSCNGKKPAAAAKKNPVISNVTSGYSFDGNYFEIWIKGESLPDNIQDYSIEYVSIADKQPVISSGWTIDSTLKDKRFVKLKHYFQESRELDEITIKIRGIDKIIKVKFEKNKLIPKLLESEDYIFDSSGLLITSKKYEFKEETLTIPSKLVDTATKQEVTIKFIGDHAFSMTKIKGVKIPSSIISIGDKAFAESEIQQVELCEGLQTIGNGAFFKNQLKELKLPDSVKSIGSQAFAQNQIKTVSIKETTKYEQDTFDKEVKIEKPNVEKPKTKSK